MLGLKSAKQPNESFSQTIRRVVRKPVDLSAWFKKLRALDFDPKAVRAIEEQIENRRRPGGRER